MMTLQNKARGWYVMLVVAWAMLVAVLHPVLFQLIFDVLDASSSHRQDMPSSYWAGYRLFLMFEILPVFIAFFFIFGLFRFDILSPSRFRVYVTLPAIALVTGALSFFSPLFMGLLGYIVLAPPLTFIGNALIVAFIRHKFKGMAMHLNSKVL